jgi:elongation factor 2
MEPIQKVFIDVPQDYMGSVTRELQKRRGVIGEMEQKDELMTVSAVVPIGESFGFSGDIRGASEGHALWSTENAGFDRLPTELQYKVMGQIRERKGLPKDAPKAEEYMD